MARSVLDIVIRTLKQGGADKETVKGLVGIKNAVGTAVTAFGVLAGAAYAVDKALDATVGTAVEYANKVETVANASGMTSEESSRTIQVLDDLRVSYEDLTASMKKNSDTDFSVEGLAKLSEEYLTLGTQEERVAFAQEKFGKQWVEMIKVLEAGPDKLRAMNEEMDGSLVLTKQNIQQAKEYQMALDEWNDSVDALKVSIGNQLLPTLTKMAVGFANTNTIREEANRLLKDGIARNREEALAMASAAVQAEAHANALNDSTDAMNDAAAAAENLTQNYSGLLDLTMNLQEGYDRFAETEAELNAQIAETNTEFSAGQITLEERDAKMQELNGSLAENAAAMEDWSKRTVFSLVQARLAAEGGIDAAEFAFLINLGEQMGIIDEKTADMATSVNDSLEDIDLSKPEEFYGLWQDIIGLPHEQIFTITTTTNGTPGAPVPYATGGGFDAGMPMRVHADEILVPSYDGVVLTRTDAMRLMAGQGGGGGKHITIYGGVTVVARGGVFDALESLRA